MIADSLRHDFYASPLGAHLLHFPGVLKALTWGTLALEWAAPPLFFFPKGTARLRLGLIAALAAMHAGIALCLEVDLFSFVAVTGLVLFLPAEFWNYRLLARYGGPVAAVNPQADATMASARRQPWLSYATQCACLLLMLYVILININGLPSHPLTQEPPGKVRFLQTACGLGQKWSMFDAAPSKNGWYVARAKLRDGSEVDLLRRGAALDWSKPRFPAGMYPNYRWRKCFREMAYTDELGFQVFRAPVAEFLCRDWNARHPAEERVSQFDFIYCNEVSANSSTPATAQAALRERLVHLDFDEGNGRLMAEGL